MAGEIQTKHVEFTPTHPRGCKGKNSSSKESVDSPTRTKSKAVREKNHNYLYLERKICRVVLSVAE